ncbi:MAG: hypothetical protein ACOYOS_00130 [Syntrophales bacterium]
MNSTHAIVDLEVWEGATFYSEFLWEITGDPAVPVDLDGVTARMQARDSIEDHSAPVLDLTTENGGIIILEPTNAGKYAIKMKPSETSGLCLDHEKRVLVYDLFFDHGTDDDSGLQQKGKITVMPTVTRAE